MHAARMRNVIKDRSWQRVGPGREMLKEQAQARKTNRTKNEFDERRIAGSAGDGKRKSARVAWQVRIAGSDG
jgi:hypothetical protein